MIETIKETLIIFHAGVSILLVLSVLFQPSKTESVFGADSSSFLKKLTIWLGVIFFVTSLGLGYIYLKYDKQTIIEESVQKIEEKEEVSDIQ